MAVLTIRGLDDDLKSKLRLEAARRGCSMEEAVRRILARALSAPVAESGGLGSRARDYFVDAGPIDLPLPARSPVRMLPDLRGGETNITLSADEELIARAREEAEASGTTLNAEFRVWLAAFAEQEQAAHGYREMMARLDYARPGRHFTREELNAR